MRASAPDGAVTRRAATAVDRPDAAAGGSGGRVDVTDGPAVGEVAEAFVPVVVEDEALAEVTDGAAAAEVDEAVVGAVVDVTVEGVVAEAVGAPAMAITGAMGLALGAAVTMPEGTELLG